MKTLLNLVWIAAALLFTACTSSDSSNFRYQGRLDSDVLRISAKTAGTIDSLLVDEGQTVQRGQLLVVVNSDKIQAQLRSQQAQLKEIETGLLGLQAQNRQLQARLKLAQDTYQKTRQMVRKGAATQQKLDELKMQVDVLRAQQEGLQAQKQTLAAKKEQLTAAMEVTRLSLKDTHINAPISGVVLNKFINAYELAAPGMALLELADLSQMKATVYMPLTDLHDIKLGQKATVHIDGSKQKFSGHIIWIASEAEFTPKTILTKETRTTLVYAVKVLVDNPEGILKIGMPVEVTF